MAKNQKKVSVNDNVHFLNPASLEYDIIIDTFPTPASKRRTRGTIAVPRGVIK